MTTQVNPARFEEKFAEMTADGSDVLAIMLSSGLSGTYNSAVTAAQKFGGKVVVVDTENGCLGQRIQVMRALQLKNQGLDIQAIADTLNQEKKDVYLLCLLDTLEYLKKGGRISALTALAGTLLSIKPVMNVKDGKAVIIGKAKGSKNGHNLLRELVRKSRGIDFDKPMLLAYTGLDDSKVKKFAEDSKELWEGHDDEIGISYVGPIIGTHIGAGAIAIAYYQKNN